MIIGIGAFTEGACASARVNESLSMPLEISFSTADETDCLLWMLLLHEANPPALDKQYRLCTHFSSSHAWPNF